MVFLILPYTAKTKCFLTMIELSNRTKFDYVLYECTRCVIDRIVSAYLNESY